MSKGRPRDLTFKISRHQQVNKYYLESIRDILFVFSATPDTKKGRSIPIYLRAIQKNWYSKCFDRLHVRIFVYQNNPPAAIRRYSY